MIAVVAAIIGFLLPWQTRLLVRTPEVGGVAWDFGVVSLFVSQIAIAAYVVVIAWQQRAAVRAYFASAGTRKKIACVLVAFVIAAQLIVSTDRLLTLQWLVSVILLAALYVTLRAREADRFPFAAGLLISVVLQSLLAAMQVFTGGAFASSLLGIAAHRATDAGAAVIEYVGQRHLRAYGGQPHPNIFGGLTLAALMLYGWILHYKHTLGAQKNVAYFSVLMTAALFFSFSRAAWLGVILWLGALWSRRRSLRESEMTLVRWCTISFFTLAILFSPMVLSRVTATGALEARSLTERTTSLGTWARTLRAHWFFGTGVGAYTAALEREPLGSGRVPMHSVPLLMLAELGVFGVAMLVGVAWLMRWRINIHRYAPALLALLPLALVDHYLWSLWAGQVILFLFLFQMFEVSHNDEADNNQQ